MELFLNEAGVINIIEELNEKKSQMSILMSQIDSIYESIDIETDGIESLDPSYKKMNDDLQSAFFSLKRHIEFLNNALDEMKLLENRIVINAENIGKNISLKNTYGNKNSSFNGDILKISKIPYSYLPLKFLSEIDVKEKSMDGVIDNHTADEYNENKEDSSWIKTNRDEAINFAKDGIPVKYDRDDGNFYVNF